MAPFPHPPTKPIYCDGGRKRKGRAIWDNGGGITLDAKTGFDQFASVVENHDDVGGPYLPTVAISNILYIHYTNKVVLNAATVVH
ncbi:hypothetical protein R6Q57_009785 [Mikania cordata]